MRVPGVPSRRTLWATAKKLFNPVTAAVLATGLPVGAKGAAISAPVDHHQASVSAADGVPGYPSGTALVA
ncbi:hypothetical protein [Streptomyces melanogenes]|uniref:hypothetical protein n=1 Tax=Streptomyces melanogenes TaxID=67326 RepID=UPI003790CE4E